jgi:hypothetical protein
MRLRQQGAESLDLLLWASSWYGAKPDPQLGPAARLWAVGNEFYGTAPDADSATERQFFQEDPPEAALAKLSRALDDLRRLGEADLRLNHPEHSGRAALGLKRMR